MSALLLETHISVNSAERSFQLKRRENLAIFHCVIQVE
jgi:hypothetical protein